MKATPTSASTPASAPILPQKEDLGSIEPTKVFPGPSCSKEVIHEVEEEESPEVEDISEDEDNSPRATVTVTATPPQGSQTYTQIPFIYK